MIDRAIRPTPPVAICLSILAATAGIAALSHDPLLILAGGSVVAVAVGLLWRKGEAPILLMAVGLQLSQVMCLPIYATLWGVPLQDVWPHVGDVNLAIWFALAAMFCLLVGMWCGHLRARPCASAMRLEAAAWSPKAALVFYLATLFLSAAFAVAGDIDPGLRQPALAASRIEWAGVFVLSYVCISQRRGLQYVVLVASFELVRGVAGFFADFKDIFVVLIVAMAAASYKLSARNALACLVLAGIGLTVAAFWSATKTDYRKFISEGSGAQVVLAPVEDRLGYMMDRAFEIDADTMTWGFQRLAQRLSYVDLLSATMGNVPAQVPFQNGALVGAVVMHVLEPRILFPDKPPLPGDTEIAVRYSGLGLDKGGNAANTSISLGYVAELYVDFGLVGTLVAMSMLGFIFGYSVKYLTASTALPAIVNSGLALVLMMPVTSFELSLVKMIGAYVTIFAVVLMLRRFLFPYLLRWGGPATTSGTGVEQLQAAYARPT